MTDKLELNDLEIGMTIWVNEFDSWQDIVHIGLIDNKKTPVTFENGKTLFFDNRNRFQEL